MKYVSIRKLGSFSLTSVMVGLLLAGCSRGNGSLPEGVAFSNAVADTALHLTDGRSPVGRADIQMLYATGPHAAVINHELLSSGILMQDILDDAAKRGSMPDIVRNFVRRFAVNYRSDYADIYRQDPGNGSLLTRNLTVTTEVDSRREDIINYVAHISYAAGSDAPAVHQTVVLNLDARTGKRLSLSDLFVPGYEPRLKECIRRQLMKHFRQDDWDALAQQLGFAADELMVPDNFIIDSNKLTFIYNENDLGTDDAQEIQIHIDMDDLDDLYIRPE